MVTITLVFIAIALFEHRYLMLYGRKKRTRMLALSFIAFSYLYLMAVYVIDDLPGPNRWIDFIF